jgi:hypothetical protein
LPEIGLSPLGYLPPVPGDDDDVGSGGGDHGMAPPAGSAAAAEAGLPPATGKGAATGGAAALAAAVLAQLASDRRFVRTPQGTILNLRPNATVKATQTEQNKKRPISQRKTNVGSYGEREWVRERERDKRRSGIWGKR